MVSLLAIAILSVSIANLVSGDAACLTKLPEFVGCMKQELFPNSNMDVQSAVEKVQTDLSACFTNPCQAPTFNQTLDSLFPSSAPNFIDKIASVFKSMSADTKACLMKETIGIMGDTCQLDAASQTELTIIQGPTGFSSAFGQLVSYYNDDMGKMRQMLKQIFLTKYSVFRSVRACQETNPANAQKVISCLNNYKDQAHKVICPAVRSCAPITEPCQSKFHDFRSKMCSCHQQCINDCTVLINKALNDTTSSNATLVQTVVDGLHFKDMITNAKGCFTPNDPGYSAFSMIEGMFNGTTQAAVMLQNMDIKGLLGEAKDMLSAMNDNEFCQNPCNF